MRGENSTPLQRVTGSAPAEHTHVPTSIGVFSKDETLQHIHMKSNENLLDNWYFPDPINQLGRTTYRCGVGGTMRGENSTPLQRE